MARRKRQAKIPTPAWGPRNRVGRLEAESRWQAYMFIGVVGVIVVAIGLVGAALFARFWEASNRPNELAIEVGEQRYNLSYYQHRTQMYVNQFGGVGNSTFVTPQNVMPAVSSKIVEEAIALQFAGEQGVSVTPEEVDEQLRRRFGLNVSTPQATGTPSGEEGEPTSVEEQQRRAVGSAVSQRNSFEVLYGNELKNSGLSDQQYRDMTLATMLISALRRKFTEAVPASAPSIHYEQILVRDVTAADDVIRRLNSGEDFATVARLTSLDPATRDKGGDVGWVARGGLDPASEGLLFSLPAGAIQKSTSAQGTFVYKIVERSDSRPLDETMKQRVADQSYTNWLEDKRQSVHLRNEMDLTTGNVDKISWLVNKVF